MATSKFEKQFTDNTGNALLGATVEIIPQANTYPTGAIQLLEHPTRRGWYYKDAVPLNGYKIYVNGALYTQHIFHSEMILYYIAALFDSNLRYIGDLDGDADFYGIMTAIAGSVLNMIAGILQLPDSESLDDPTIFPNAIWTDNQLIDELEAVRYQLKVRFMVPENGGLITKSFIDGDEIKKWVDCGVAAFDGTQQTCIVTVPGGNVNDRYFLQPNIAIWNANDMLMVSAETGQFLVTRGAGGTSGLSFNWFRRKNGTF